MLVNMNSALVKKSYNKTYLCLQSHSILNYFKAEFKKSLSTSSVLYGKRNFRKFLHFERGSPIDKEWFKNNPEAVDCKIFFNYYLSFHFEISYGKQKCCGN